MRGLSLLPVVLALLFGLANAFPSPGGDDRNDDRHHGQKCLTDQEAVDILNAFENLYIHFDRAQAERLIADEFQIFSDSSGLVFYTNFTVCLPSLRGFPRLFKTLFFIPANITRFLLPSTKT